MFKHVMARLKGNGHKVSLIARNKDILIQLLENDGIDYINTDKFNSKTNLVTLFINHIVQYFRVRKIVLSLSPDLLVGTSFDFPQISKKLNIPYINVFEDDASVDQLYAWWSIAKSDYVFAPAVCQLGKWEKKKISYNSYHELAFLHPNHFTPNRKIAEKYVNTNERYFLIRFTAFKAHHDYGKKGIDAKTASELINLLNSYGKVFITSERDLPSSFEQYRLQIIPNDIHDVMAFSTMIIGDSQSMAMEAACLGIPSVRLNDYAGRISVLEELEKEYKLTFGFTPKHKDQFVAKIDSLLSDDDLAAKFQERKGRLLSEKSDTQKLFIWLIENFPKSTKIMKENPEYLLRFGGIAEVKKTYSLRKGNTSKTIGFSVIYFLTLLFFYLFPLSQKLSLNSYHYLSFRGDHIIHLLVFAPFPFLLIPLFLKQSRYRVLKASFLAFILAILFEMSHLIVPYRAFTFPDMLANIIGVALGTLLLYISQSYIIRNK